MGRYNLCCAIDLLKCTKGSNPTDDCKKPDRMDAVNTSCRSPSATVPSLEH